MAEDLVFSRNESARKLESEFYYSRSGSSSSERLRKEISQNYGVEGCIITPSGMCAISVALRAALEDNANIIHSHELYCDTPRLFEHLRQTLKLNSVWEVDERDNSQVLDAFETRFRGENNILFVESCSNPNGYVLDFDLIPRLRKLSSKLIVIVDNTWLTEEVFNPFSYGADVVVSSLTKYPSGGKCIAGVVLSHDLPLMSRAFDFVKLNGLHVSPHTCDLVLESYVTMKYRIARSFDTTQKVLEWLSFRAGTNPPGVKLQIRPEYPLLPSHVTYERAHKYFTQGPSVVVIKVGMSKNEVLRRMKNNELEFKTSFGSATSRFDPWPYKEGDMVVCRLSIGYEDSSEKVILGLKRFLD